MPCGSNAPGLREVHGGFQINWDGLRPTLALSAGMELMDQSESKGCQDIGLPQTPTSLRDQP